MAMYSTCKQYNHLSRYSKYRQIIDDTTYIETFNQTIVEHSDGDQYHIVTTGQKNRLDIIALQYYNDASLWWVIALANNMIDPFIVTVDTILRIPSLASLFKSGGALCKNG